MSGTVGFGFAMCLSSGFGQTFFISLFNDNLRESFALTHGDIGMLYFVGTLSSAITLVWAGKLIDSVALPRYTLIVTVGLALAGFFMAKVTGALTLAIAFFLLRLFGQGLSSHTGITTVSRLPPAYRGRAISICGLGFSSGEALLPWIIVPLIAALGWREVWLYCALAILVLTTGITQVLLRLFTIGGHTDTPNQRSETLHQHQWTRHQVLRDSRFWLIAPAIFAPSIISTALFFHQQTLAAWSGFAFNVWAGNIASYSICAVFASVVAGQLVDRYGVAAVVRFYLLPFILSLLFVTWLDWPILPTLYYGSMGLTVGIAIPSISTLWLELYGAKHLGAIRALMQACMVFGSALGPPLFGLLLDQGITWSTILLARAMWMIFTTALLTQADLRNRAPIDHH